MFYTIQTITPICRKLHAVGRKLVLATGFFDLLHKEHVRFLEKAKEAGDTLVVAVESDERARVLKGEGRPVETQLVRCEKLSLLTTSEVISPHNQTSEVRLVDYTIALPTDFNNFDAYDSLMFAVRPGIYAVSSHTSHQKSKKFLVEKYGGKLVVVHEYNPEISTTKIIANNHV